MTSRPLWIAGLVQLIQPSICLTSYGMIFWVITVKYTALMACIGYIFVLNERHTRAIHVVPFHNHQAFPLIETSTKLSGYYSCCTLCI